MRGGGVRCEWVEEWGCRGGVGVVREEWGE